MSRARPSSSFDPGFATPAVNLEPTYEELLAQKYRGVDSNHLREAALEARRALAGGLPMASVVTLAVNEARAFIEAERRRRFQDSPDAVAFKAKHAEPNIPRVVSKTEQ